MRDSVVQNEAIGWEPLTRLEHLFDPGSMQVVGSGVRSRTAGVQQRDGDGVVVATGKCNGTPVAAYAQDSSLMAGALGAVQAETIARHLERAHAAGRPVVAMIESAGARVQEGIDSLAGYATMFRHQVAMSGRVPQIGVVSGAAAGGGAYSPALMDFVVMTSNASMFLTGPAIVKAALGEVISGAQLGGPLVHGKNGVAHHIANSEAEAISYARELLDRLQVPWRSPDSLSHDQFGVELLVPRSPRKVYDIRRVIERIADPDSFLEVQARWARNIAIGFARVDGHSVGFVANQPAWIGGVLDSQASEKAARFVRTCNSFGVPLVALVDTPGFLPGEAQEAEGVIRRGAKLVHAFAEADVPKITVVLRKAFGGAYIAMNSKALGASTTLAWPTAEIGVMSAVAAVQLVNRREIEAASGDNGAKQAALVDQYRREHLTARKAAALGHIDEVIDPHTTRERLAGAIEFFSNSEKGPARVGNIPL
ncbi:MAG: carboxyl transferase domain-containing protein [Solirubrobacterales bacterium]